MHIKYTKPLSKNVGFRKWSSAKTYPFLRHKTIFGQYTHIHKHNESALQSHVIFGHIFYKGKQPTTTLSLFPNIAGSHPWILRKTPIFRHNILNFRITLRNDKNATLNQPMRPCTKKKYKNKTKCGRQAVGKILSLHILSVNTTNRKKMSSLPSTVERQMEWEIEKRVSNQTTKRLVKILLASLTGIYFHIILAGKCTLSGWLVASSNMPRSFCFAVCINGYICIFREVCKRSNIAYINRNTIHRIRGIHIHIIFLLWTCIATVELHMEKPFRNWAKSQW